MADTTDSQKFQAGAIKFNFSCAKRTFSMMVSPYFDKFTENLICEEIVLKMGLPIFDRKCETLSLHGIRTEAVGMINSTVQCLKNGVQQGTMNIKARVVRDFYKLFHSDGLCGENLKLKLSEASDASVNTNVKKKKPEPTNKKKPEPTTNKPYCAWASPYSSSNKSSLPNLPTSPEPTKPPNHKDATTSLQALHLKNHNWASPPSSPPASSRSSPSHSVCSAPSSISSSVRLVLFREQLQQAWSRQNGDHSRWDTNTHKPVDENWWYDEDSDTWYLPSFISPAPADYDVEYIDCQLGNMLSYHQAVDSKGQHPLTSAQVTDAPSQLTYCVPGQPNSNVNYKHGFASLASHVPTLPVQAQQPAVHHRPPTPDGHLLPAPPVQAHHRPATHLGHGPPVHQFRPSTPERQHDQVPELPEQVHRQQASPARQGLPDGYIKPFTIPYHQAPYYPDDDAHPYDGPPSLPPGFSPCGPSCGYAWCQCVRSYNGRDWMS
eukprot:GFUD01138624.1.p1 GENE.GFUD01138624.1~~GFUD01138624.1.p1  ORF type:complete len:491 (-),score=91.20 GFUD01138624.1:1652-3124(-)